MKSLFLFFILLMSSVAAAFAKDSKPELKISLEIVSTHVDKDTLISFDCYKPSSLSQYHKSFIVGFLVNNTTNERIFIEWENARINNSRICYGDESMLSMDMPKADEAVSANSLSIKRDITATKMLVLIA